MARIDQKTIEALSTELNDLLNEFCKKHHLKKSRLNCNYDNEGFSISKINFLLLNEPINYGINPEQYIGSHFITLKDYLTITDVVDFEGFKCVSDKTGKKYKVTFSEMLNVRLESKD